MRLIAEAEMTACLTGRVAVPCAPSRYASAYACSGTARVSAAAAGACGRPRTGSPRRPARVLEAGDRVRREARLALLAVGDDRRAGLLEARERVAHRVVVEGVELLGSMLPVAAAWTPSISAGGLGMLPIGSVGIGTESTLPADPVADARLRSGEQYVLSSHGN